MKNKINDMLTEVRSYILNYAKAVCFCADNAEDLAQSVIIEILPKIDFSKELDEIKSYARFKMNKYLKDKYRVSVSTGIQYIHECPTSFVANTDNDDIANFEETGVINLSKEERLKTLKHNKGFKYSVDFNERPDPFLDFEYSSLCSRFINLFDGRTRDVFVAMLEFPDNHGEIAARLGVTRQAVELIINNKIRPSIAAALA